MFASCLQLNTTSHSFNKAQLKYSWKETSKRVASVALTWILYSALFSLLLSVLAIEFVPLGPWFTHSLIAAWLLGISIGGLATAWPRRRKKEESERTSRWTLTQRQKKTLERAMFPVMVLGIAAIAAIPFALIEVKEDSNAKKSEVAKRRFAVVSYLGNGPEFEIEAFDQTLAELEDSYQSLKEKWTIPSDAEKIRVWLYRDIRDYQTMTGQELSAGHLWCSEKYGPVIALPLGDAPSTSTDDAVSQTPTHEMVHALMCQSTGWEGFRSIPSWFHEGIAMRYHTEGFRRFWVRGILRVKTLWKRTELIESENFCYEHPSKLDEKQQPILYVTGLEFIRFLETEKGIDTLNRIVDDVREGTDFNESMNRRLGGTCVEMYSNWKESF